MASRWTVIAQGVVFILFPLLFMVLATPPVHPRLPGSAEEQILHLADAATRWRLVHFGLAIGSVFGAWTVFSLGRSISRPWMRPAAQALLVGGVASSLALVGIFWQEMVAIPSLAKACATVDACLARENQPFFEGFAQLGWRKVPYLAWGGIGLTGSVLLLGLLGWRTGVIRVWEALLLAAGCVWIIVMAPGLHGDAIFGFIGVLIGLGSYAVRSVKQSLRGTP